MSPAVTPDTRKQALQRLRSETFDVLILGGGINGAGTARDLMLRAKVAKKPISVALVEQNHFASGTSSKNSHLIHGGLRYLKQFAVGLVRESLHERAVLLKIAPHLVDPQPFLMPLAGLGRELFYNIGLAMYDWLAGNSAVPHHRRVPLDEVRRLEPNLAVPGMTAAAEFYDGQVRSARLVLENIFEAIANGAACVNYVRATRDPNGRVQLHDTISGETFKARAKSIIDATGPWSTDPKPRLVRGSHIVLPRLNASDHAIAYFEESGRIIFFIPWGERRDKTLIGTTDVDHDGSPDDVRISQSEIEYLRRTAATVYPESTRHEPLATFSSLRPLLASAGGSPTRATREHRIFFDHHGILRITGGKFTTYRSMSEEAADLVTEKIAPELRDVHVTASTALNGNTLDAIDALRAEAPALAARHSVSPADVLMLIRQYGFMTTAVLDYIDNGDIDAARHTFAFRHEMAQNDCDFLEVSTTLGHEGIMFCSPNDAAQVHDRPRKEL